MEPTNWFRISVIVALFIGSFYVLLPTILQEDPGLAEQAEEVGGRTQGGGSVSELRRVRLDVVEGEPEALAKALRRRLEAADVGIDGVVTEEEQVVVRRKLDTPVEDIYRHIGDAATIHLVPLPVDLPEELPTTVGSLADLPEVKRLDEQDSDQAPLPVTLSRATSSAVSLSEPLPGDTPPLALVVNGKISGVILLDSVTVDPVTGELPSVSSGRWASLGRYDSLQDDIRTVPLPGRLQVPMDPAEEEELAAETVEEEHWLPEWFRNLLPDTRMPLGLDLQGGIDLTLQVELSEALLGQTARDAMYLEERANEKGIDLAEARRNRFDPILELRSDTTGASGFTSLVTQTLRDQYDYYDSINDKDGTWHRFIMTSTRQSELNTQAVQQVIDVIRRRVADTKVRDPVVVQKGGGRISVQLPGMTDSKVAVSAISKTAVLEFRLVDPDFRQTELNRLVREAEEAMPKEVFENDLALNEWLWDNTDFPKDRIVLFQYDKSLDEETGEVIAKRAFAYPLVKAVVLTGQDVSGADVQFDPTTQQPGVGLEFKPAGANIFCDFTGAHVKDRFAIILDGVVESAPSINERICGGRARISMGAQVNASEDAKALAVVLRTGSLNAPVSIGSVRQIGPQLGRDAVQAGSIATLFGGIVVLVFMVLWYRRTGFLANIALVLNIMLMLSGLSLFGWTLTLPGIAGIALTIGMAVDANIIIFERIREELRMGQNARKAVDTGFKKAAVAVLDANVTTAIAGVVLFSYGDITLQGFAVTLLMGIGTTLFTALFVTRSLLELVTRRATARLRI
ncbi:MAG: protein translocase subunit SecD [Deltaproteobacteria bacterium]|nr:MAG: protein translocase subunit SecD [Deltaproteobacteria bacterium]